MPLLKSKMLPGDKLFGYFKKVEPIPIGDGTYRAAQNIFTDFDKKYNRTMYVAVKSSQDSLDILKGHYYPWQCV